MLAGAATRPRRVDARVSEETAEARIERLVVEAHELRGREQTATLPIGKRSSWIALGLREIEVAEISFRKGDDARVRDAGTESVRWLDDAGAPRAHAHGALRGWEP